MLSTAIYGLPAHSSYAQETADMTAAKTQEVVAAANALIATFDADALAKLEFPFPDSVPAQASFARTTPQNAGGSAPAALSGQQTAAADAQGSPIAGTQGPPLTGGGRPNIAFIGEQYGDAVWSNYPVSDVPRPGIQLGEMTATERAATMTLLETLLSPDGFQRVSETMGSDQALADQGQNFAAGEDVYTLAILGTPSATAPWMVEFGGHHLGLNIVIYGPNGVMTPTLTGAQPAVYTNADGKTVRALADENDKAFVLLEALTDEQRGKAILDYSVSDLVSGPGKVGQAIVPEGLKGSEMTADQQALLLDVISEWAGIIDPAYSAPRIAEIHVGLADTYFAWSGPTTHEPDRNGSSYYRIQGPKLIIEFSPQGVGGDPTMHVHTMYRDPTNDYGLALTAQ
jgi:hypothetical protein